MATTMMVPSTSALASLPARYTLVGSGVADRVLVQPRPRSLATSSPNVKMASETTP